MTSNYKELKNHLHNTLGITKDDVRDLVEKAVERIVERRLEILFNEKFNDQYQLQHIVDDSIKQNITRRNWYWGESEDSLDDYIKKEVVKALLKQVKFKIALDKDGESALELINKPKVRK